MTDFSALLEAPGLAPVLSALPTARLVGGCVRDTLAHRPIADIDIATPDPPDQALRALQKANLRVIPTGLAHGTLTAISAGRPFEITTLRRDTDTDGRHAKVEWTTSFEQDAARRDFTINALSLDQSGTLHDYFAGQDDLAAGRVRFVGRAAERVAEDYLRILRFFRFYARYGVGAPDQAAAAAIRRGLGGLARLSAERVWSEIKRILEAPAPEPAVALMQAWGVLQATLPEASDTHRLARLLAAGAPADPILRLAALLSGDAHRLADRLLLSTAERTRLLALSAGHLPPQDADDADLRRALADTASDILAGRSWLAGDSWDTFRRRLAGLPAPVFPLEGRHALQLGAAPGPQVGEALRQVRAWWLHGGCVASQADCLRQLAAILPGKSAMPP